MERLFGSLCSQIDGGHLTNALKTCDKSSYHPPYIILTNKPHHHQVLRLHPHDPSAFHTKLFLLIQTERYASALTLVSSLSPDDASRYAFQRAYCLYRLHREDETCEILKSIKDKEEDKEDDRGMLHLEAQLVCTFSLSLFSLVIMADVESRTIVKESIKPLSICITSY
jgi:signal recognition particle subunit SRP72